ncbi:hypothetical protein L2E82_35275 [Cichorium intybus]|uniref:Uncharacterized protein n=1 Tax=Cichorium intybus TaxID=13427 RepID=A0ACB9BNK4_CICIN|nr:hypothetical protein L2E82_35275 [Cichorium intybus]
MVTHGGISAACGNDSDSRRRLGGPTRGRVSHLVRFLVYISFKLLISEFWAKIKRKWRACWKRLKDVGSK